MFMVRFIKIGLMVQESKGRAQSHHYHLTGLFFRCEKKGMLNKEKEGQIKLNMRFFSNSVMRISGKNVTKWYA